MSNLDYSYSSYLEYDYSSIAPEEHLPPHASFASTTVFIAGLIVATIFSATDQTPTTMASTAAVVVGISLLLSIWLDYKRGLRNLFRADLLCLAALYALTLLEFLFPQEGFDERVTLEQTVKALHLVFIGMGGLAIGRHLVALKPIQSSWLNFSNISNKALFQMLLMAAFLGYLHMLISVNFDIFRMIDAMLGPRFSEPWSRGRLGGATSLISELALMLSAIPPLAGVIWNRRQSFSVFQLFIVFILFALTLFQGFSGGTRNVFASYLIAFLIGYLLTLPQYSFKNTIIPILIALGILFYASDHMLAFRQIGLRNYILNEAYINNTPETFAVDYNLWAIGLLADAFPEQHDFLGLEIIVWSIVKPIPRFFWPGKPEGLSVSIEEIAGAEGWTVAATYLGEAYMMAGIFGVIGVSLFFGALAGWWNRMALQSQSAYAMVVYALGFFALGVTMRSMFWLTTLILPIVALVVIKKLKIVR
ncbi:MAG TPA: O-antigen polymerase [Trichocoleus sp.]|jgi:oligosaccharide repeat unit polymerase